jgi:hypothetical protein
MLPPLESLITPDEVSRFYSDLERLDKTIREKRELCGGRELARHRAEIVNGLLTTFFYRFIDVVKPTTRLSFGVCGGSGRLRSSGNSDTDTYLFLINDHDEENLRIWRQYANYINYVPDHIPGLNLSEGVSVFTYFSVQDLETQTVSSLLDMYPLYDNTGFEPNIREHLRNVVDPLLFKLEKIAERKSNRCTYPQSPDNLELFNVKEGGLREIEFYCALKAIDKFSHTSHIDMPSELREAQDILFTARLWINHKKPSIRKVIHEHDIFKFSDFHDFVDHFGNEAFEKLHKARKTATRYADAAEDYCLENGIKVSENVVYGNSGLRPNPDSSDDNVNILMDLISQAQHYGLPIVRGKRLKTFLIKTGNLPPHDKFVGLLLENGGRLYDSFKFLNGIGQLDNVIPGYARLKYKLPSRGHVMHSTLQGAIRRRLRNLDNLMHPDAEDLDNYDEFMSDRYHEIRSNKRNLASLRLALITKDLPDIDLYEAYPSIEKEIIVNAKFILDNHRFFKDVAYDDMISEKSALESFLYRLLKSKDKKSITLHEEQSATFRKELSDSRYQEYVKDLLGMLLLYIHAYMDHPHARSIKKTEKMKAVELYKNAIAFIDQKPCYDDYDPWSLSPMGRSLESALIDRFPGFFNNSIRVRRLDEYANELVNVMYSGKPIVRIHGNPDRSASISIFSTNYKGLFRLITGALYEDREKGLSLRSAQVYSPEVTLPGEYKEFGDSYPFAMDFLTIDVPKGGYNIGKLREKLFETLSLDRELKISPPNIDKIISQENISIIRNEKVNRYRLSLIGDLDFKNLFFPISDKISGLGADLSVVKGHPDEEGGYRQNYFFKFDDIDHRESDRLLLDTFHVDVMLE